MKILETQGKTNSRKPLQVETRRKGSDRSTIMTKTESSLGGILPGYPSLITIPPSTHLGRRFSKKPLTLNFSHSERNQLLKTQTRGRTVISIRIVAIPQRNALR
ncbi:hypothetical protein LR48_Vigan01g078900 [Vigna angularis]|uniref:Uncharacterized protein n=1 Tax=Phaseolus angularis TaxID=3914 RepID=A0A0L9TM43_PHAAN|nr:hypothetical protein LR48_Vigan01g078900 [Vigna angularis]